MKILNHCGVVLVFVGLLAAAPYMLLLLQELPPTKVLIAPLSITTIGVVLFVTTKVRLRMREGEHEYGASQQESVRAKQHREIETFSQMY